MKINYLSFNGASIAYYSNDKEHKDTIVFLHPAFSSSTLFELQFCFFEKQYNIVAFDMPGHGKTGINKNKSDFVTLS